MKKKHYLLRLTMTHLFVFVAFFGQLLLQVSAQSHGREDFLVTKISRYESPTNWATMTYNYDEDFKLQSREMIGEMIENGQVREAKYLDEFVYEDGLVSVIYIKDLTHFLFSQEIHFIYDEDRKLVRSEVWKDRQMLTHTNYHYEGARIVSTYADHILPFEFNTYFYDLAGNVSRQVQTYPKFDEGGRQIPGEFEERELYYEYDDHPKPYFGIDYLVGYQPIPWLGATVDNEMCLSNNNMTKAFYQQLTYDYTYNEHGLPDTFMMIYEPIGPSLLDSKITFTYQLIGNLGLSNVELPKIAIYPNPTQDIFTVAWDNYGSLLIYDMLGREVLNTAISGNTEINIDHLPKGIYNVKIISDDQSMNYKSKIVKR